MFTTFVIPTQNCGGTFKVKGVNRDWGFTFLMSPSGCGYTIHFEFLGFEDDSTFCVSISQIVTNMRFNLEEKEKVTPTFEPGGIAYSAVDQHRATPHTGCE